MQKRHELVTQRAQAALLEMNYRDFAAGVRGLLASLNPAGTNAIAARLR